MHIQPEPALIHSPRYDANRQFAGLNVIIAMVIVIFQLSPHSTNGALSLLPKKAATSLSPTATL